MLAFDSGAGILVDGHERSFNVLIGRVLDGQIPSVLLIFLADFRPQMAIGRRSRDFDSSAVATARLVILPDEIQLAAPLTAGRQSQRRLAGDGRVAALQSRVDEPIDFQLFAGHAQPDIKVSLLARVQLVDFPLIEASVQPDVVLRVILRLLDVPGQVAVVLRQLGRLDSAGQCSLLQQAFRHPVVFAGQFQTVAGPFHDGVADSGFASRQFLCQSHRAGQSRVQQVRFQPNAQFVFVVAILADVA